MEEAISCLEIRKNRIALKLVLMINQKYFNEATECQLQYNRLLSIAKDICILCCSYNEFGYEAQIFYASFITNIAPKYTVE